MKMKMGQDVAYRVDALSKGLASQAEAMQRMEMRLGEHQSLIQRAQSQGDSNGGKLAKFRESVSERFQALSQDLWRAGESFEEKIEDNWRKTAEIDDVKEAEERLKRRSRYAEKRLTWRTLWSGRLTSSIHGRANALRR